MYKSKLAAMIDQAVQDCITCGSGKETQKMNGETVTIVANWADNEKDIEIGLFTGCMLRGCFMERIPQEYR